MAAKTVLIVDDEPEILELLSRVLEDEGYKVLVAGNIQTAMRQFQEERPDIVITDIRMPGGNGDELLHQLRAHSKDIPVIFITSHSDFSLEEALNEGADALLAKPFSLDELIKLVERLSIAPEHRWAASTDRVALTLNVGLGRDSQAQDTINIARGGMFVALADQLPRVLDKVFFKFNFEDEEIPPLEGVGLVRWVRRQASPGFPRGVGIEFINIPAGPRTRLLQIIKLNEVIAFIPNTLVNAKKAG